MKQCRWISAAVVWLLLLSLPGRTVAVPPETRPASNRYGTTVGPDTTILTGPLTEDGLVDYVAAINNRLSEGITRDNNAVVLLVKATGTDRAGLGEFHTRLAEMLEVPDDQPGLWVSWRDFTKRTGARSSVEEDNRFENATLAPWKSGAMPDREAWLAANEEALKVVALAVARPKFWCPLVIDQNAPLTSVRPDDCWLHRVMGKALLARAMRKLGDGDPAAAWNDVRAAHRLAHLACRNGGSNTVLSAVLLEFWALLDDVALLQAHVSRIETLESMRDELQRLEPMPDVLTFYLRQERFTYPDAIQFIARQDTELWMKKFGLKNAAEVDALVARAGLPRLDWDRMLRRGNQFVGRLGSVPVTWKSADERCAWFRAIGTLSNEMSKGLYMPDGSIADPFPEPGETREAYSNRIADRFASMLQPNLEGIGSRLDLTRLRLGMTTVACALELYRRREGHFPDKLSLLVPKDIKAIPDDFYGRPLTYSHAADGFTLISFGIDGLRNEDPRKTDDIVIEVRR